MYVLKHQKQINIKLSKKFKLSFKSCRNIQLLLNSTSYESSYTSSDSGHAVSKRINSSSFEKELKMEMVKGVYLNKHESLTSTKQFNLEKSFSSTKQNGIEEQLSEQMIRTQSSSKFPMEMSSELSSSKTENVKLNEERICKGCGIILQDTAPKELGYCPENILNKNSHTSPICQRCYGIQHNGKLTTVNIPHKEYEKKLRELRSKDMLLIQLIDILDIKGSMLSKSRDVLGNKPVLLVVNKADLIPKKSGFRRLIRTIEEEAKNAGITRILGIHFVSSTKCLGIKEIISAIQDLYKGRDLCIVGATNVGKSSFLNTIKRSLVGLPHKPMPRLKLLETSDEWTIQNKYIEESPTSTNKNDILRQHPTEITLIEEFDEDIEVPEQSKMTTSAFPGTTLAVQPVPFGNLFKSRKKKYVTKEQNNNDHMINKNVFRNKHEDIFVLDTPGIVTTPHKQKLLEALVNELDRVVPTKNIENPCYRMTPGRSLFIGGLARVDYDNCGNGKNSNNILVKWYGSLPCHLTKTFRAEEFYLKHAGKLLSPPSGDCADVIAKIGALFHSLDVNLQDHISSKIGIKPSARKSNRSRRTAILEIVFPAFGWLSIAGVDLDGTESLRLTMESGILQVYAVKGNDAILRKPLFPYELNDVRISSCVR